MFRLDELVRKDVDENVTVLLCSANFNYFSEIRRAILEYVPFNQIVDVFSDSAYFDEDIYYDEKTSSYEWPRNPMYEAIAREIYKNKIGGAIAECGVWKGETSKYISKLFPDRTYYLFDTFEGFDARDIDFQEDVFSKEFRNKKDWFKDTSVEMVLSNIAWRQHAVIRKGYFPDTAAGLENEKFAFVLLDTDLYKPIKAGLEFFYPRLVSGGYIIVDDLSHPDLKGVRQAVVDFSREFNVGYVPIFDEHDSSAVFTKGLG